MRHEVPRAAAAPRGRSFCGRAPVGGRPWRGGGRRGLRGALAGCGRSGIGAFWAGSICCFYPIMILLADSCRPAAANPLVPPLRHHLHPLHCTCILRAPTNPPFVLIPITKHASLSILGAPSALNGTTRAALRRSIRPGRRRATASPCRCRRRISRPVAAGDTRTFVTRLAHSIH